ncbi:MAG: HAD family hydrolase [Candidatus Heimdallarchaeota archaeon]
MNNKFLTLQEITEKRQSINTILFDLDGTLVDSQEGIIQTQYELLRQKGYNITMSAIRNLFGKPLEVCLATFAPDKPEDEIWELVKEFRELYAKNHLEIIKLLPNAKKLLEELTKKGYRLGIASTKLKKFITEAINHLKIADYFEVVVSGYEVENHKPAPDLILETARQMNVAPQDCVYIGDSPTDIIAGREAGTLTIAILTGANNFEKMSKENPDFIINDLTYFRII